MKFDHRNGRRSYLYLQNKRNKIVMTLKRIKIVVEIIVELKMLFVVKVQQETTEIISFQKDF